MSEVTAFEALIGRRIITVTEDRIALDDGTVLDFREDQDCCAGASFTVKDYDLSDPPVITSIKDSGRQGSDEDYDVSDSRTITLLGINGKVGALEAEASHNGYYFATLTLTVSRPGSDVRQTEVVVNA